MTQQLPKRAELFARTINLKQTQVLLLCQWDVHNNVWILVVMFDLLGVRTSIVVPYVAEGGLSSRSLAFNALHATTKNDMELLYKRSLLEVQKEQEDEIKGPDMKIYKRPEEKAPSLDVSPQDINRLNQQDAINAQISKDLS